MSRIVQIQLYLGIGALLILMLLTSLEAVAQENFIETLGTKAADLADDIGDGIEDIRNDVEDTVGDATGGVGDTFTAVNELLKKFAAIIAIIVVVGLGVLLRYVANLIFFVVVGLLILFDKRNWAVDMKAVIEGLIGLGIVVGSAFAWITATRDGLVAGISAGVDAQIFTWILTPIAAFVFRALFPRRFEIFAEIKKLAQ